MKTKNVQKRPEITEKELRAFIDSRWVAEQSLQVHFSDLGNSWQEMLKTLPDYSTAFNTTLNWHVQPNVCFGELEKMREVILKQQTTIDGLTSDWLRASQAVNAAFTCYQPNHVGK